MRLWTFVLLLTLSNCASDNVNRCTSYIVGEGEALNSFTFLDFNSAIKSAKGGDVICFKQGVYSGFKIKDINGGELQITVQPIPGSKVVLKNNNYKGAGITIENSRGIALKDFIIEGGLYGIYVLGSSNIVIKNNIINNIGQEAIMVRAKDSKTNLKKFIIEGNHIMNTGKSASQYGEGIYIGNGDHKARGIISNVKISNNVIQGTLNEAIDIKSNTTGIFIDSNLITNTSLMFNGAITIGTSDYVGPDSEYVILNNVILGVENRLGYRPYGIAVGRGNTKIYQNIIVEVDKSFIGICLFSTFTNSDSKFVELKDNVILSQGKGTLLKCTDGGTGLKNFGDVKVL